MRKARTGRRSSCRKIMRTICGSQACHPQRSSKLGEYFRGASGCIACAGGNEAAFQTAVQTPATTAAKLTTVVASTSHQSNAYRIMGKRKKSAYMTVRLAPNLARSQCQATRRPAR